MDKHRKRVIVFGMSIVIMAALLWMGILFIKRGKEAGSEVGFFVLPENGFYEEAAVISVEVPKGAVVYYTDNCEEPTPECGCEYTAPIPLCVGEEERVLTYRFKAYYADGTESGIITRTYFCGKEIHQRFTTNVLHITGTPEDLFGEERGIFVPGKRYTDYMEKNPGADYGPDIDANFFQRGPQWERPVAISYFSAAGEELFAVDGGVRIHGALTRLRSQKSFRLFARKEYDTINEFRYPVLGALYSEDGALAEEHKRLVVRNSGNDNGYAFIRSELIGELAGKAGFPDVMYSEPAAVYINGEYRGFYWMENTFDAQYFENRYGLYEGEFVTAEGAEAERIYDEFAELDLTKEADYRELQKRLDVENYLQYYAIENYICNTDWPHNNVKLYHYVAGDDGYRENSVFDGRYRHLLFDTDYGLGIVEGADTRMLSRIMEEAPLFAALMERTDCRDYFVQYTCDLMNGALSASGITEGLQTKHASRDAELRYMFEQSDVMADSDTGITYEGVLEEYEEIYEFAKERPQVVLSDIIYSLDYQATDAYTLYLKKNGKSGVQINSLKVDEDCFTGVYFGQIETTLVPGLSVNEIFSHWVVNGEVRKEQELVLTSKDMVDYQIEVELVVKEAEEPVLQIAAIRSKGAGDYIELVNSSQEDISTGGYFLSDSEDVYKDALPDILLGPGESIRFYGRDCMDPEGLGEPGLNFNLKQGEVVSLTYRDKVLESIVLPDLSENGVYRRQGYSNRFVEEWNN